MQLRLVFMEVETIKMIFGNKIPGKELGIALV